MQHDFTGKALLACTTNEVTGLNTWGINLMSRVCTSVIAARMLAKFKSMLLESLQLNVWTAEIYVQDYTICCLQAQQGPSFSLPLHWKSQSGIK